MKELLTKFVSFSRRLSCLPLKSGRVCSGLIGLAILAAVVFSLTTSNEITVQQAVGAPSQSSAPSLSEGLTGVARLWLLTGSIAFALPQGPTNINELSTKLCNILNSAFTIFVVVSIAFVLYAAFLYLTAGGNAEQVNKATKTLTYAAVAILVAILAKGFPKLIGAFIGTTSGIGGC